MRRKSKKKRLHAKNRRKRLPANRRARTIRVRSKKSQSVALRNRRDSEARIRALAALARMRRENLSLAQAARIEHIKPSTFLRYVGSAVHRSGPGKPWKPTKADRFSARMTVLTALGPTTVFVRGSRERTRLARYDIALRKWRAAEDGADKELMAFQGQTVGGHVLITNPDLLIQFEEAGQLDFDALYFSVGAGS
jgi:hypothetical protein